MKYILTFLLAGTAALFQAAEPVRILDTIGNEPLLRRAAMQSALEKEGGSYRIGNSSLANAAAELKTGGAQFVICTADELAELRKQVPALNAEPYAIEALGVAVNFGNEVTDMALKSLREIFGGKTIYWKEFNGSGFTIHKIGPGRNTVGSLVFSRNLLQGKPAAKDVALMENAAEPLIMAGGNRNALSCGAWNLRPMEEVRFLTIDGIEGTPANVRSGKYPLAATYYICGIQSPPKRLLELLQDPESLEFFNLLPAR
jgi:hypothetical protein